MTEPAQQPDEAGSRELVVERRFVGAYLLGLWAIYLYIVWLALSTASAFDIGLTIANLLAGWQWLFIPTVLIALATLEGLSQRRWLGRIIEVLDSAEPVTARARVAPGLIGGLRLVSVDVEGVPAATLKPQVVRLANTLVRLEPGASANLPSAVPAAGEVVVKASLYCDPRTQHVLAVRTPVKLFTARRPAFYLFRRGQ